MTFQRISTWQVLATAIAMLLLIVGISQTGIGGKVLQKIGLAGESGSYTALSFENPQGIPTQLPSTPTGLQVAFDIHNSTATTHNYSWSILLLQGQRTQTVTAGLALVSPRETTSITRTVNISCQSGQVQIEVALINPAEHIDAWMSCKV